MKDLEKKVMIFGVIAMLGLSLLLCFVPSKYEINMNSALMTQNNEIKEP